MNPVIQSLLGQLQQRNPQNYQFITNLMNNGGNPDAFLKQIMGQMPPQQRQNILNTAKSYRLSRFLSI